MSRRDINDPGYWEDAARMKAGIDPLDDLGEQGPTPRNNEPRNRAPPIGKPINRSGKQSGAAKFKLVPFREIRFTAGDEWRIKRVIPRQGVAVLIGSPKAFKSFIALNISFHIALGWDWAGRKTLQGAAIYIAAENVGGTRKRKAGFEAANFEDLPDEVPFYLIETAPNLGIEKHDRAALITSIEAVGVRPGIIVIDTLAQSLGGGEENNAGMVTFVANATALAAHFKTCVLIVHHVGLSDDRRSRGHTSLPGGADAMLLTERQGNDLTTVLKLDKLKDDEDGYDLIVRLNRIVIGEDAEGDEVSTLVITSIEKPDASRAPRSRKGKPPKRIPAQRRLLMEVVVQAIDEIGCDIQAPNGPIVTAAPEDMVRARYYSRIAEQAEPNELAEALAERQRKAFTRSIKGALDAKNLIAKTQDNMRFLWLPLST